MDFQWAKKAISIAQKRIDAVLDITPEEEGDVSGTVKLSSSSFETVIELEKKDSQDDGWELRKESDGNGWGVELPDELINISTSVPIVDAEPNPIRDSHSEGLYLHSPTSNSPDEGGCSGDDPEAVDRSTTPLQNGLVDPVDPKTVKEMALPIPDKESNVEEIFSQKVICDDALTVVSSDIEVLRQVASSIIKNNANISITENDLPSSTASLQGEIDLDPAALVAEIAQLRLQLQHQERRNKDLQARNQKLEKKSQEFMTLKAACAHHSATETLLMKKLSEKEAELASLLQEGEKLANTNGKLSKELKRLRKSLSDQEQLNKRISQLEVDNELAKEEIRALTVENSKLRATIKALEDESSKIRMTEEILTADLRRRDEKIEKLAIDLQRSEAGKESALDDVRQLETLIQELTSKADERELSSKGVEELTQGLNEAVQEERKKNGRLTTYIDSLEKRLSDMMEAQRATAEMVAIANQPLLHTIRQLEEDIRAKENSQEAVLFEKEKLIMQLIAEKDELLRQNKEFLGELGKLRALNNESQRAVVELSTRLGNFENDQKRIEVDHERTRKLNDSLRLSLNAKDEEVQNLYSRLREEAESADRIVKEKQEKTNYLTKKCEEYEKELAVVRAELGVALARKVSRSPSATSISVEQEKLTTLSNVYLSAAQCELVEAVTKYEQSLRQIATLQAKLTEMEGNANLLSKTMKQLQDLRTRYENLLEAHGEKIERIEELEMDLEDVKKLFREQMELLVGKG